MFRTIAATIPTDPDYPPRTRRLDLLSRVLDGRLYDGLRYAFGDEKSEAGEYIPIRERRPAVRYNLSRIVVSDSVSLLFSEGHFPMVDCPDRATRDALLTLIKDCRLNAAMLEAALMGSVGSVVLWLRLLRNRIFVQPLATLYLTPSFDPEAPDRLLSVREQYKVQGRALADRGYAVDQADFGSDFWFRRDWDANTETWYLPWPVRCETVEPEVDTDRTVIHNLGFVPMIWVRNLPGGDEIDGGCTFEAAIDSQIEIEYQLSQAGRGLKYSSDPTLLIKEPAMGGGGSLVKGGGNAIVVDKDGDARMLEIGGSAAAAVIDYCRCLRELTLEAVGGNRSSADKISAAQSGRAMELMNQSLIWLADKLRISYGEGALLDVMRMMVAIGQRRSLVDRDGHPVGTLSATAPLCLKWPHWYAPTADDRQADATTLKIHGDAGHLSRETAVKSIAPDYDIEDIPAELARIAADRQATVVPSPASSRGPTPATTVAGSKTHEISQP
jgi:hypothetical protein